MGHDTIRSVTTLELLPVPAGSAVRSVDDMIVGLPRDYFYPVASGGPGRARSYIAGEELSTENAGYVDK